jgi:hypothetical protein
MNAVGCNSFKTSQPDPLNGSGSGAARWTENMVALKQCIPFVLTAATPQALRHKKYYAAAKQGLHAAMRSNVCPITLPSCTSDHAIDCPL